MTKDQKPVGVCFFTGPADGGKRFLHLGANNGRMTQFTRAPEHPMSFAATYLLGLAVISLILFATWLLQLRTRNAGHVDITWSFSLGIAAVTYALLADGALLMRLLAGVLGLVWSARLGGYLYLRNVGTPEDSRYTALREKWGQQQDRNMLLFYLFQGLMAWILSLPFAIVAFRPDIAAAPLLVAGVLIWAVAVLGEALADYQLMRFKADPDNRGQVCRDGLWYYSRHPNYFFESLHWVAYVPLAFASGWWWLTLISPVLMAWLLLRVSGVPGVETPEGKSKRAGYDEYVRTTSPFIPWPPKKA